MKKLSIAGLSLLTAFSLLVGLKDSTPSQQELIKARKVIIASSSFITDYNKKMVPSKTFIKKGLEGEWDVINEALDDKKSEIRIPLLWANPLSSKQAAEKFKEILSEEFQRILNSHPDSKNLKVKRIELENFEYVLHHPRGMFGEPKESFHRKALAAVIHVKKKLF